MNSSQTKKTSWVAGVTLLAVVALLMLSDYIFGQKVEISYYFCYIPIIVFSVLLIFLQIKSYSYGILLSIVLMGIINNSLQGIEKDVRGFVIKLVAAVILLVLLVYKNIKKAK